MHIAHMILTHLPVLNPTLILVIDQKNIRPRTYLLILSCKSKTTIQAVRYRCRIFGIIFRFVTYVNHKRGTHARLLFIQFIQMMNFLTETVLQCT